MWQSVETFGQHVCVEYVVQGTSRNLKIEFKDDVVLPMST